MTALHLKAFAQLQQPECDEMWVYMARYWLGIGIGQLHLNWAFLQNNNTPHNTLLDKITRFLKNTPKFYWVEVVKVSLDLTGKILILIKED